MNSDPGYFTGKSIFDVFPKQEAEFYFDRIKKSCISDQPLVYEDRVSLPVGDNYFISTFSKITDSNNQILGIQIISQDISEQKSSEIELLKTKSLLLEAEGIANIGSWDWNLKTNVSIWSDQLFEIYGRNKEDGSPSIENYLENYHPEDHKKLQEAIEKAISDKTDFFIEYRIYRYNDGIERLIQSKGKVIFDENGQPERIIGIAQDITEQKATEQELINAKEHAEESDRLKSAFLANMSHEIRTPLNSILGFSELLSDEDFDQNQKNEFISQIINNGNNLLNIISDIMDISKIEAGEIMVRKSQVELLKLITSVYNQFIMKCQQKNLSLIADIPSADDGLILFTDTGRLHQILNNLLSNAIKFTPNGYIKFGYQCKADVVEFFVEDSGIGISPENHKKIFSRFYQIESPDKRKYGGNGLGLAITRNLIELMGGKIWLESEKGKGSTFFFTLPIK